MKRRKLFIPKYKKKERDGRIFACGRYVHKRACVKKKEGEQRAIATVKERGGENCWKMVTMKDFGTFDQPLSTLHEKKEDSRELERKKK